MAFDKPAITLDIAVIALAVPDYLILAGEARRWNPDKHDTTRVRCHGKVMSIHADLGQTASWNRSIQNFTEMASLLGALLTPAQDLSANSHRWCFDVFFADQPCGIVTRCSFQALATAVHLHNRQRP